MVENNYNILVDLNFYTGENLPMYMSINIFILHYKDGIFTI
jgi:hypothetical protein